jgi:hypothetical protein
MRDKITFWWNWIQGLLSIDGGLYVDLLCLVITARMIAPLFGKRPMTMAEAGVWSATIATYGASKFKGGGQA